MATSYINIVSIMHRQ